MMAAAATPSLKLILLVSALSVQNVIVKGQWQTTVLGQHGPYDYRPPTCRDISTQCELFVWTTRGNACESHARWMRVNCERTCGFCVVDEVRKIPPTSESQRVSSSSEIIFRDDQNLERDHPDSESGPNFDRSDNNPMYGGRGRSYRYQARPPPPEDSYDDDMYQTRPPPLHGTRPPPPHGTRPPPPHGTRPPPPHGEHFDREPPPRVDPTDPYRETVQGTIVVFRATDPSPTEPRGPPRRSGPEFRGLRPTRVRVEGPRGPPTRPGPRPTRGPPPSTTTTRFPLTDEEAINRYISLYRSFKIPPPGRFFGSGVKPVAQTRRPRGGNLYVITRAPTPKPRRPRPKTNVPRPNEPPATPPTPVLRNRSKAKHSKYAKVKGHPDIQHLGDSSRNPLIRPEDQHLIISQLAPRIIGWSVNRVPENPHKYLNLGIEQDYLKRDEPKPEISDLANVKKLEPDKRAPITLNEPKSEERKVESSLIDATIRKLDDLSRFQRRNRHKNGVEGTHLGEPRKLHQFDLPPTRVVKLSDQSIIQAPDRSDEKSINGDNIEITTDLNLEKGTNPDPGKFIIQAYEKSIDEDRENSSKSNRLNPTLTPQKLVTGDGLKNSTNADHKKSTANDASKNPTNLDSENAKEDSDQENSTNPAEKSASPLVTENLTNPNLENPAANPEAEKSIQNPEGEKSINEPHPDEAEKKPNGLNFEDSLIKLKSQLLKVAPRQTSEELSSSIEAIRLSYPDTSPFTPWSPWSSCTRGREYRLRECHDGIPCRPVDTVGHRLCRN